MRIQNASLPLISLRALIERSHGVMANANKKPIQSFQGLEQRLTDRDAKIRQLTVSQQQKRAGDRTEIEQQILVFLAHHARSEDESIADQLGVSVEEVRFHLQELEGDELIVGAHFYGGTPSKWSIDHEGRRYLNERNLLP